MWFWQEWSINKAVTKNAISRQQAIWCFEEALRLHNLFVRQLWKPRETDVDEAMREWDVWTIQVMDLVEDGQSKMITWAEAITKMNSDAEGHQFYIDHPEYLQPNYGDVKHHAKWRDRWLAIAKLLKSLEEE